MLLRKVGTIIAKTVAKKSHKKDDRRRQNLKKQKKTKKNIYIYIYIAKKVSVSCLHFRRQGQIITQNAVRILRLIGGFIYY